MSFRLLLQWWQLNLFYKLNVEDVLKLCLVRAIGRDIPFKKRISFLTTKNDNSFDNYP